MEEAADGVEGCVGGHSVFTQGARGGACNDVETRLGEVAVVVVKEVACGATMMKNVTVCSIDVK